MRHLKADVQTDLLIGAPAKFDRMDESPEVVVCEDHLGCLFRYLRPRTHRHTDIGLFECGCIVHRIPSHRHHHSLALHQLDQAQLVLRRDTPKDMKIW